MKLLGLIPARGGSKGIPGKNLKLLNGKPLIAYTFESALGSQLLDEIHLTSDADDIIELAKKYEIGVPYKRPANLSGDTASMVDVVLYHIEWLMKANLFFDAIVLLQPTSPIRHKGTIDDCIKMFLKSKANSLIAVSEAVQHPYELFTVKNKKLEFINQDVQFRQAYPPYYFITGSIYIIGTDFFLRERKFFDNDSAIFIVSPEEAIDIDDMWNFNLAEYYLNKEYYKNSRLG